jgi:hypothetical protein
MSSLITKSEIASVFHLTPVDIDTATTRRRKLTTMDDVVPRNLGEKDVCRLLALPRDDIGLSSCKTLPCKTVIFPSCQ